jgi:hypothetical protein
MNRLIVYSIIRLLADDAARDADIARRKALFMNGLNNMKILAEGGTLPPRPARGAGAPAGNSAAPNPR